MANYISLYDKAVIDYLKVVNPLVYYALTSRAKKVCAKYNKDQAVYPFISVYRDQPVLDTSRDNRWAAVKGFRLRGYREPGESLTSHDYAHMVPIDLLYQIDIWSTTHRDSLDIATELLLDLKTTRCVLEVELPDEGVLKVPFRDVQWNDNSDLESEEDKGLIYRQTISFTIEVYMLRKRTVKIPNFQIPDIIIEE